MTPSRSIGISIDGSMYTVGGGYEGLTKELDDAVMAAGERLSAIYRGFPVTVRFNSDRRSGGAYLRTSEVDGITRNSELGIGASLVVDREDGYPDIEYVQLSLRIRPVAMRDQSGHVPSLGLNVESLDVAEALIRRLCVLDAAELVTEIERRREHAARSKVWHDRAQAAVSRRLTAEIRSAAKLRRRKGDDDCDGWKVDQYRAMEVLGAETVKAIIDRHRIRAQRIDAAFRRRQDRILGVG